MMQLKMLKLMMVMEEEEDTYSLVIVEEVAMLEHFERVKMVERVKLRLEQFGKELEEMYLVVVH